MSKKHFIKFAEIIAQHVKDGNFTEALSIFHAVCEVNDNPNFDMVRFKNACKIDSIPGGNY